MARQGVVEEHRNVESRLRFVPDAEQVKGHMKVEANFFTRAELSAARIFWTGDCVSLNILSTDCILNTEWPLIASQLWFLVHRNDSIFNFFKNRFGNNFSRHQFLFFLIRTAIDYFLCVLVMNSGQGSELLDGPGVDIHGFDCGWRRNPNCIRRSGLLIAFRGTARGQPCPEKNCSYNKRQDFNVNHLAPGSISVKLGVTSLDARLARILP
jgi:hypothetical protein